MLKFLAKFTSVSLILLVILAIFTFILFPIYPDLRIKASQIDGYKMANNTTLTLFTRLSPPNQALIEKELLTNNSLEHVSTDQLSQLKNEGKVLFNMESQNTSLYLPSVNIRGAVVDGQDATEMDRGFWHFPLSGQPGQKGNTVIIAHRFLHLPPRTDTFFLLDKVRVGDKVIINQKEGTYRYTVTETKVVNKNDRSILAQTYDYRVTLVTCHPLWTSDKRLVVIAKLDKIYSGT